MCNEDIKSMALELECRHLQKDTRQNPQALQALLHQQFTEIDASGKIFHSKNVDRPLSPEDFVIHDFQWKFLADTWLLTHYLLENQSQNQYSRRSSLWVKENNQWKLRFHQGTPCENPVTK